MDTAHHAEQKRQWIKRKRAVWKRLGICLSCGGHLAIEGRSKCGVCAEMHDAQQTARRAKTDILVPRIPSHPNQPANTEQP